MNLAEELIVLCRQVRAQKNEIRRLIEEKEFLEEASGFFDSRWKPVPMMNAIYLYLLKYLVKFYPNYKQNTNKPLFYVTIHVIRYQMS